MRSHTKLLLLALIVTAVRATPVCAPTEYTFSSLRTGSSVRSSSDGAWALSTTRGSDGASDASAVFDSAIPPIAETDLGTPGECAGGPGRGVGGRKGARGENCVPLGKLLVAHGGDLTSLRRCVCSTEQCANCQPDDDARGAEFKFDFLKTVHFRHIIAVDLEGSESLSLTFPDGATRFVEGLGDNSVNKVDIDYRFQPGESFILRCTGSCGFAMFAMSVCPHSPEPRPTPETSEPPCVYEDAPIDFENYPVGFPVSAGEGFTLRTHRFGPFARDDASAVFDSRRPTGGDVDLGSPNEKCANASGPGPGVGAGGAPGSSGENCAPLGNILIAHEGDLDDLRAACARCPTCADCAPDDNVHGALFEFRFSVPTVLKELVVLDVDETPRSLVVTNHVGVETAYSGYGDNGKLVIPLHDAEIPAGGTLAVRCTGSCGIVHIARAVCIPSNPPPCVLKTADFNEYKTGARVVAGDDWTLETTRIGFRAARDVSAVFNTSRPTGGDTDLGSPNGYCRNGGPGVGVGGRPGRPGENCKPVGQVLIAHTGDVTQLRNACVGCPRGVACNGCEPNDHAGGALFEFVFTSAVRLERIVLMDLDDAPRSAVIETTKSQIYVAGYGDNSMQSVGLAGINVAAGERVMISCASSCAIVKFEYFPCV